MKSKHTELMNFRKYFTLRGKGYKNVHPLFFASRKEENKGKATLLVFIKLGPDWADIIDDKKCPMRRPRCSDQRSFYCQS